MTASRATCDSELAAELGAGEAVAPLVKNMDGELAFAQYETLEPGTSTHRDETTLEPPADLEGLNHEDVTTTVLSRSPVVSSLVSCCE